MAPRSARRSPSGGRGARPGPRWPGSCPAAGARRVDGRPLRRGGTAPRGARGHAPAVAAVERPGNRRPAGVGVVHARRAAAILRTGHEHRRSRCPAPRRRATRAPPIRPTRSPTRPRRWRQPPSSTGSSAPGRGRTSGTRARSRTTATRSPAGFPRPATSGSPAISAEGRLTKRAIFKGLGRDDHNNPSLVFRRDGHIMVFFSPHSGHHLPPPGIPSVMRYRCR